MLRKDQRLNLRHSFKWVASGQRFENDNFKLFYKNGQNSQPLIGITSSSKVFKNATDRNRARRLISTAVQQLYSQLPPTINIVIMPKNDLLTASSDHLIKELQHSLERLKIL